MALPTFYFQASLPATRALLDPLGPLVREILVYTGFTKSDAIAIARQIETAAQSGLSSPSTEHVTITFEKDGDRLRISLHAPHLPADAPAKGLMDTVSVGKGRSGHTYRYERRVPEAS